MQYSMEQRRHFGELIRKESAKKKTVWPDDYRAFRDLVTITEMTVPGRNGDIPVYVIEPRDVPAPSALHINLHGGGWIKPHGERDLMFCAMLAASVPCTVVDVDYRTTDMCRYPVPYDDCYDAAVWACENAERFDAQRSKVTVGGHSAGASMAASCVIRGRETGEFLPCGQTLDYGNFDLGVPPEEKPLIPGGRLSPDRMRMSVSLLTEDDPDVLGSPYCSVLKAPDSMLEGLPETLIISAGKCPFRAEDAEYAERLEKCGVPVTQRCFMESDHGFVISLEGEWREAQDLTVRWLKERVK